MLNMRRFTMQFLLVAAPALILWISASHPAKAASESFFAGKTVRLIVGYSPGGGFDTFARLMARYLKRHIPGNPTVLVLNMPGAGSLVAANRVYAMQPGNGLNIVTFHFSLVTQALTGDPNVKFDPSKFIWLGEPTVGGLPQVFWIRTDLGINSLEEVKNSSKPLALGATASTVAPAVMGEFMRQYMKLPVRNVLGYRGSSNIMVALERKELDGRVISLPTMQAVYRRLLTEKVVLPIFSMGEDPRIESLPNVPTLEDVKLGEKGNELAEFLVSIWKILRVYAVPPGTPPGRVKILREAFRETLKDPELLKDAERQKLIISPLSAEYITETVHKITKTKPSIIEVYKGLIGMK